jgi:hypothetical protein
MPGDLEDLDTKLLNVLKQWDDTHDAIMRIGNATPENMTERIKELHQQRKWMSAELQAFSRYLGAQAKREKTDVAAT